MTGRRFVIQEFQFDGATRSSEEVCKFAEELAEGDRYLVEIVCTAAFRANDETFLMVTFERIDLTEPIEAALPVHSKGTIQ